MFEATIEETAIALGDSRQAEADKRLLVVFSTKAVKDNNESIKQGRPIYQERDYITIMVPGDKDSVIERPATDMDRQRFPIHYAAFKQKQQQETVSGTPLKMATFISQAQAKELEYFHIFTVEQLAGMSDAQAQKIMGFQRLKQNAADYLTASKDASALTQMREELSQRDVQIAHLTKVVEGLTAKLEKLEKE